MNMHILLAIFIAIAIALLVLNILNIITKSIIVIAASILDKSFKVDFKSELYVITICVLIISIYFLI